MYIATDNHSLEVLETIKDSLTVVVPHIREMAENSKPEPYTVQNITIASWNLVIAVVAALFGFLGTLFGYLGYKFSKQTARNVVRVSTDVQRELCLDFIIDLYRSTMRAIKYGQAYKDKITLHTNDVIALKLPRFNDIFHIDAYNLDSEVYIIMKHLKDRMQNYNENVELCCDNMKNGRDLSSDFQLLSSKPMHILIMVKKLLEQMESQNDYIDRIVEFLLEKHIKHIIGNKEYLSDYLNRRLSSKNVYRNEYTEYISKHKGLEKEINLLFSKTDLLLTNPCPDYKGKYELFKGIAIAESKYVEIMNKKEWNSQDLHTLLINMIAIDTIIDTRPYNEA